MSFSKVVRPDSYPLTALPKNRFAVYWPLALYALPLACLWWLLINQLRLPWSVNPQYAYGVAVPFLCAYLLWRRWQGAEKKQKVDPSSVARPPEPCGGWTELRRVESGKQKPEGQGDGQGAEEKQKVKSRKQKAAGEEGRGQWSVVSGPVVLWSLALCALLYAPTRLVQEANPEWSLVSWALAFEVIGLTLLTIHLLLGASAPRTSDFPSSVAEPVLRSDTAEGGLRRVDGLRTSDFAFPICFFLVAVPWPYFIERPVIQGLTRLNTACAIEILGWLNIPALQQGNVIELRTGEVGIDEACSGIRSLQATLMLSLFFGEFYSLKAMRRALLVLSGFGLAFLFNVGRTTLLTWVAAREGVAAISQWHDPAGVTILVGCFVGLWGIARALQKPERLPSEVGPRWNNEAIPRGKDDFTGQGKQKAEMGTAGRPGHEAVGREEQGAEGGGQRTEGGGQRTVVSGQRTEGSDPGFSVSTFQRFSIFLTAWLVAVELGVGLWYGRVEAALPAQVTWHVAWPVEEPGFRELPIAQQATEMLRYDEAKQAQWTAANGTRWQLSWFYWKPGKAAGYLAKSHNPLVCMPATGYSVSGISPPEIAEVNDLRFPFRIYSFEREGRTVHVLYSRWDDRATEQSFGTEGVTGFSRLRSVWSGRGNHGQRVIGLALWGAHDAPGPREQLLGQLQKVLVRDPSR